MKDTVLRCGSCGLPWARVQNGVLIVVSHHHGEKHTNVIPVSDIAILSEEPDDGHCTDDRRRETEPR